MTITLITSTPADGAISVPLSSTIAFTIESDADPIDLSTLDVTIGDLSAVTNGIAEAGFILNVVVTPIMGGEQAAVSIVPAGTFNSYEHVVVGIVVNDNNSTFDDGFDFTTEDVQAPIFVDITPAQLSINNSTNTPIFFRIEDQGSGADLSTLNIVVKSTTEAGTTVVGQILGGSIVFGFDPDSTSLQPTSGAIDVYLRLNQEFPSGATVTVDADVSDQNNNTTISYTFEIIDLDPPAITNLVPAPDSVNINENTTIALAITDPNGDGVNLTSVNIKINNISAVVNGVPQISYAATSIIPTGNGYFFVVSPINPLPSAQLTSVYVEAKDIRGTQATLSYTFTVRDFKAPQLELVYPANGSTHILPATNLTFTINEDTDGYGVDFGSLEILVDGYAVNTRVVDGYEDSLDIYGMVDGYNVNVIPFDGYGSYDFPSIKDSQQDVLFRGYHVDIYKVGLHKYDVVVNPYINFDHDAFVALQIAVADLGGHANSASSLFQIAGEDEIVTIAIPDTGTYKNFLDGYGLQDSAIFLYNNGVELKANLPNARTFYTLDGTMPSIDKYGNVRGTTRFYSQPILLQREGLHVIKFFSVDEAGNQEPTKQEVYMIAPLPPEARPITSVPIVADITLPTRIIPVETTALFKEGLVVKVLDNIRPPIVTKILSVNSTTIPPFIIVEDEVERLSSNFTIDIDGNIVPKSTAGRNARVVLIEQPIDPSTPIEFDSTAVAESFYIGSDASELNQADSVMEQFRILNIASTDEQILADFTLLNKGARFTNQEGTPTLPAEFSALEKQRSNLPNNTLVLLDLDGSVQNHPRQGVLKNNTTTIRDKVLAGNTIVFTIYVKKGTFVDRELLRQVLRNFTPVDLQVRVDFIEVD